MSNAVRAGKAFVEIHADRNPLLRGMKQVGADLRKLGTIAAAAGAAGFSAMAAAVKVFSDTGSQLTDMAGRTGASVEALSTLGFAAGQTGAGLEDVEKGMRFLAKSGKFAGQSAEEAFRSALGQLAAIPDDMERSRQAMELFGKSGTALLPMAAEFQELEERARSLGITMSGRDAAAADRLGDSWGELLAIGKSLVVKVGAVMAPAFQAVVDTIVSVIGKINTWIDSNRELIDDVMLIATSLDVMWAAIKLGWAEGTTWLETTWIDFLNSVVQWVDSWADSVIDIFVDTFTAAIRIALNAQDTIAGFLGKEKLGALAIDMIVAGTNVGLKGGAKNAVRDFAGASDEEAKARIQALQDDLDRQRREFDRTKERVKDERAAEAALPRAQQLDDSLAAAKTSVVGTFSAAAAGSIGIGGQLDDIASNTKQTVQHLKKIAGQAGGLLVT